MATTKKVLSTVSVLVLSILVTMPAGAVIPPGFSQVVLFADNSIQLKKVSTDEGFVQVGGDVVVNDLPVEVTLGADQLMVEKNVTIIGDAKADSITIKKDATVDGSVFYNTLSNSGTVTGGLVTPLMLPVYSALPIFETGVPGAADVVVPAGGSDTLPPGAYRDIIVGAGATLSLVVGAGGGIYDVNSIKVDDGGSLTTDGFTRVRVADSADFDPDTTVGALAGVGARNVVFYVDGIGSILNAVDIGQRCDFDANVWARNGTVRIEKEASVTGAILAENIQVEKDVTFVRATFWDETPIAGNDFATTDEDVAATIDVLANDTDPDGDPLAIESVTQGANGSVVNNVTDVTYTPNPDFFGSDSFSYRVCDNLLAVDEDNCVDATVTVTVTSVNDPPLANADSATTPEDTPILIDVLANDEVGPPGPPPEGGTLSIVSLSDPAKRRAVIVTVPSPAIQYSPDADFFGNDSFTYEVCDDGDGFDDSFTRCSTGTVSVTVTAVPDPPVADPQTLTTSGGADLIITLTGSDADGDALTFTITTPPTQGAIIAGPTQVTSTSADVTYRPNTANDVGDSFVFQVDDNGNGGSDTAVVTINPDAAPEPETCSTDAECDEGFECNTTLGICEPEPLGVVEAKPDTVETLEDTPVTILLVGAAPCDPTGAADPTMPCDGVGNDVPLTFSLVSGPTCVTPPTCSPGTLSGITQGSGVPRRSATIDYTPAALFNGTVSFVFQVAGDTNGDGDTVDPGETSTATVTVEVEKEADAVPPVVQDISSQTPLNTAITLDLSTGTIIGASAGGPVCGNGTREKGEQCDDGNNINGDGCSSTCQLEAVCGNGIVETGEQCDDGNTTPGDGCDANCQFEGPLFAGPGASSATEGDGERTASFTETQTAGPPSVPVPLTVGAGWTATATVPPAFFWTDDSPTFADDGPFTFTLSGPGCVSVTDDFLKGARFRVYDNGTSAGDLLGETSTVATDNSATPVGPDAAYEDPTWSSGTFALAAGSHSIQIEVLNDVSGGRGYIRADLEPATICDDVIEIPGPRLTYRVQSVPPASEGTLKDSAGKVITAAGYLLPDNLLRFEPASAFKGTVQATYDCFDNLTKLRSNIGILDWLVFDPNPGTGVGLTIDFQGTGVGDVSFDVGGSVVAICSADCTESFAAGEIIKLQARPIETSTFGGWGGDCSAGGSSQIYTITLPAGGATCTATFNP